MGATISKQKIKHRIECATPVEKFENEQFDHKDLDGISWLLREQAKRRISREKSERKFGLRQKNQEKKEQEKLESLRKDLRKQRGKVESRIRCSLQEQRQKECELTQENQESKKNFIGASDPENEDERVAALKALHKDVEKPFDINYDRLTQIAETIFKTKMVFISLVDKHSQWLKSTIGLEAQYTCRNIAFCSYTIKKKKPLIIRDTLQDSRFASNPLVTGPPHLRFYAGAPIQTPQGYNIGTFCISDTEPHSDFDTKSGDLLQKFADTVYQEMELNHRAVSQKNAKEQQERITEFADQALCFHDISDIIELAVVTIAENLNFDFLVYITPKQSNEYESHDVIFGRPNKYQANSPLGWDSSVDQSKLSNCFNEIVDYCLTKRNTPTDNITIINSRKEETRFSLPQKSELGVDLTCGVAATIFQKEDTPHGVLLGFNEQTRDLWSEDYPFISSMARTFSSVIERTIWTRELTQERKRSDDLLLNVLPQPISLRLKAKETPIADGYQIVTILFADLVGFTDFSSQKTPKEVVGFLNEIFSGFDRLVSQKYQLEKVKTIGDAYMCAGGLLSHEDDHPTAMFNLAQDMFRVCREVTKKRCPNMQMRIGINTGSAVAGVIGQDKFMYDLWGDAVNVASRMESNGMPGKIQMSETSYALLDGSTKKPNQTKTIDIKGKGKMKTFVFNA